MPLAISVSIFNKKKSAFEENCTQIIEGIVQAYFFFENTVIYVFIWGWGSFPIESHELFKHHDAKIRQIFSEMLIFYASENLTTECWQILYKVDTK